MPQAPSVARLASVSRWGGQVREYVGRFATNWSTYEAPLPTKLRLLARNRFRAIVLLRGCCGHHGQPGC